MAHWYHGLDAVTDFAVRVPITANGQPAVAFYLWNDDAGEHLGWSITVLTLRGQHIAEITSFLGPEHIARFGLPASLP